MGKSHDDNIRQALKLAGDLLLLVDRGVADSEDNGCLVLYGVVRDCAYRIRDHAKREREAHRAALDLEKKR